MRRTLLNVLGALLVAAAAVIPAAADPTHFTITAIPQLSSDRCGITVTLFENFVNFPGIGTQWTGLCTNPPPNFIQFHGGSPN